MPETESAMWKNYCRVICVRIVTGGQFRSCDFARVISELQEILVLVIPKLGLYVPDSGSNSLEQRLVWMGKRK